MYASLGINSSMFMNCSVSRDVWHVRSSVLGQNVMFKVWSGCYVTRLVLEPTVWCSWTVQFFVMFDMSKVRFWAKMWCSESSMFRHSMFRVFEVHYFTTFMFIPRLDVCTSLEMCPNYSHTVTVQVILNDQIPPLEF